MHAAASNSSAGSASENEGGISGISGYFGTVHSITISTAWPAYTTTYGYDGLGRPTSVTTADGAVARTSYYGNITTITDQANKTKTVTTDGLGRISQVVEDQGGLNIITVYTWGANSTLQKVTQGTQNRTYGYDSAGRMTSATQPESGTVYYWYDNVGNVTSTAP